MIQERREAYQIPMVFIGAESVHTAVGTMSSNVSGYSSCRIERAKKCVTLQQLFLKSGKDTKKKFSPLKENRLTNYMTSSSWKSPSRTNVVTIMSNMGSTYAFLFYLRMCWKWAPPRSRHIWPRSSKMAPTLSA